MHEEDDWFHTDVAGRADVRPRSLRWIDVHMIEEDARHVGHADPIREAIDGATGGRGTFRSG